MEISPTNYGVGYTSNPVRHKKTENRKATQLYSLWLNMLKRCYCAKSLEALPTYKGCYVDSRWHDSQVFGDWATIQQGYGRGWHLDKDVLVRNSKVYSPETCVFLPHQLNSLLINCKSARGSNPVGVYWDVERGLYQAYLTARKKRVSLGRWATKELAFEAYKLAKERHVKEVAEEWRSQIDPRAYEALMNYEVLITD